MSDSETEQMGKHASHRTGQESGCRRCDRGQGFISKHDINLCRQRFREITREVEFKKYR